MATYYVGTGGNDGNAGTSWALRKATLNGAEDIPVAAGDPWATALPGAYGAGSAGKIVGDTLNATVGSRLATAGYTAPLDAAGTRAAVGLAAANLDTQLADLPTNGELATALAGADDATLAAIAALNNLSSAQAQSAAAAALAAYDPPTKAELDAADDAVLAAIAALNDLSVVDVLAMVYEGPETFAEFLRLARAVLVGETAGGGTGSVAFRDRDNAKNRVTATVDSDGNRAAVVTDGS